MDRFPPSEEIQRAVADRDFDALHALLLECLKKAPHENPERETGIATDDSGMYSILFNTTSDGIWINNRQGEIVEVNDAYCAMSGYSRDELVGMRIDQLEALEQPEDIAEHIRRIDTGIHDRFESKHRRKDGTIFDVDITALSFLNDRGGIAIFVRDITVRKEQEAAIRRQAKLVDTVIEAIISMDADFRFTSWNHAAETMLGWSRQEVLGKSCEIFNAHYPAPDGATREQIMDHLMEQGFWRGEMELTGKDGSPVPVFASSSVLHDEDGGMSGIVSALHDLTDMRRMQAELDRSRKQAVTILESISDSFLALDKDFRLTYINKRGLERTAFSQDDVLGKTIWETFPQVIGTPLESFYRQAMESREPQIFINSSAVAEGRQFELHAYPMEEGGMCIFGQDITERRQTEDALRKSEALFRTVIENSRDGINMLDLNTGRYVFMSPAQIELTGFTAEEMKNLPLEEAYDRVHPDDRHISVNYLREIIEGSDPKSPVVYRWKVKSGEYRWFSDNRRVLRNEEGQAVALVGVSRDITEQKQAEEALSKSERKYRTLFESIDIGFCIVEVIFSDSGRPVDYRFLEVNPAFERQTGLHDAQGKLMRDLAPLHEEHWFEIYGRIALTGIPERFENRAEQLHRWYDVYAFRVEDPALRRVAILFKDITGQKESGNALREAERKYRDLVRLAPAALYEIDFRTNRFTSVNEAMTVMLGYSSDELLAMNPSDILDEEGLSRFRERAERWLRGDTPERNMEYKVRTKDGRWLDVILDVTFTVGEDGKPLGATVIGHDITKRKRAEEALRESEERYHAFFDNSLDAVLLTSPDGSILEANRAACDMFQMCVDELRMAGRHGVADESDPRLAEALDQRDRTGRFRGEINFRRKDGTIFTGEVSCSVFTDIMGQPRTSMIIRDVTDKKEIAGKIARLRNEQEEYMRHEVKNLFTPLYIYSQSLLYDTSNLNDKQVRALTRMKEVMDSIRGFIDNLKLIHDLEYGQHRLRRVGQSLDEVLAHTIMNIEPFADSKGVSIIYSGRKDAPPVALDSDLFPGVLFNLIKNAIEHVAPLDNPDEKIVRIEYLADAGDAVITIHNLGAPIPPERLVTFFEKFNVGPEKPSGSGLGTTYAFLIIKAHGGDIAVTSTGREGTTVTVRLPFQV